MMFKGTIEVGKEYELNNGEVHKCEGSVDCLLKIGMSCYTHDGRYCASTADHTRSVRGPAVGTLAELDVKPGDVVEHVAYGNGRGGSVKGHLTINAALGISGSVVVLFGYGGESTFRIISRAEHTAKPTLFGGMTDAEKGALLLANHGGQGVQAHINGQLLDVDMYSILADDVAYRVKPKPVVKTVVLSGNYEVGFTDAVRLKHTHKLKFDMVHGEPTNPRFERW